MKKYILFIALFTGATFVASAQESTATILDNAMQEAKAGDKNILVKFEASWCVWCKRMSANLESEAVKDYFDKNYVITPIVALESPRNKKLENEGSLELLKKYKAQEAGLPFFVILDSNGKLLADSFNEQGNNLGCPASQEEVASFVEILRETSDMSDKDAENVTEVFLIKK